MSVYVRCGLTCTLVTQVTCINEHYKICDVEVSPQNTDRTQNFIVLGVYRPLHASLPTFIEKIEGIISAKPIKPLMIAGDVNVDLLMDGHNLELFNCLLFYNFYLLIDVATRVSEISSKCLDQMWYNKFNVYVTGTIITDITYHYPIFAAINVETCDTITKSFCVHSSHNIDTLCNGAADLCNYYLVECVNMSVTEKCTWFENRLWSLYSRECPKKSKTISVKKLVRPWITDNIRRMANYNHHLFNLYKNNRIAFQEYNNYKNNLCRVISKSKRLLH